MIPSTPFFFLDSTTQQQRPSRLPLPRLPSPLLHFAFSSTPSRSEKRALRRVGGRIPTTCIHEEPSPAHVSSPAPHLALYPSVSIPSSSASALRAQHTPPSPLPFLFFLAQTRRQLKPSCDVFVHQRIGNSTTLGSSARSRSVVVRSIRPRSMLLPIHFC